MRASAPCSAIARPRSPSGADAEHEHPDDERPAVIHQKRATAARRARFS
jgi:hypothetical protein